MLIGREKIPEIPIESYSKRLIFNLHNYLDKIEVRNKNKSWKANEKAKIYLRWVIYPNDKELKRDYDGIKNDIGDKTKLAISDYTRCIMSLLGKLAECVVIDRCLHNRNTNIMVLVRKCVGKVISLTPLPFLHHYYCGNSLYQLLPMRFPSIA